MVLDSAKTWNEAVKTKEVAQEALKGADKTIADQMHLIGEATKTASIITAAHGEHASMKAVTRSYAEGKTRSCIKLMGSDQAKQNL
jgi:hypothetical protein